jgi:hypothetical protein
MNPPGIFYGRLILASFAQFSQLNEQNSPTALIGSTSTLRPELTILTRNCHQ